MAPCSAHNDMRSILVLCKTLPKGLTLVTILSSFFFFAAYGRSTWTVCQRSHQTPSLFPRIRNFVLCAMMQKIQQSVECHKKQQSRNRTSWGSCLPLNELSPWVSCPGLYVLFQTPQSGHVQVPLAALFNLLDSPSTGLDTLLACANISFNRSIRDGRGRVPWDILKKGLRERRGTSSSPSGMAVRASLSLLLELHEPQTLRDDGRAYFPVTFELQGSSTLSMSVWT